jgi:putative ABC transport system ATP-binding protein
MDVPVVELRQVTRAYRAGDAEVLALAGVDLVVRRGEMVAVLGPSGSGKSTLLNVLGCLDRPSAGVYLLDGAPVQDLDDDALADVRSERLGFVFQGYNLLPRTSALDNVLLPMLYDRRGRFPAGEGGPEARARAALTRVGLANRMDHAPHELSGGQQQRVALARALVTGPALVLADEPTGNLDTRTTVDVMALLQQMHREGVTMIVVTHEEEVAAYCTRRLVLRDGRIVEDTPVTPRDAAADLAALDAARGPA